MPKAIIINGLKITPGQSAQTNLNVAKLPTHTMVDLPVYIFRGLQDGPGVLLTAGLHGDELNGIETIRRLIAQNSLMPRAGTVIAIPIVNVFGFLNCSRYLPDGRDLNRSFPGNMNGSLASRIAYTLMNQILPVVDYGVDLHTGSANSNYPQVRCDFSVPENLALARAFAAPLLINAKFRDDSFRKSAYKAGKNILVFEGGAALSFDEFAIEEAIAGIKRLLGILNMIDEKTPQNKSVIEINRTTWIRARSSGLFRVFVDSGKEVKRNQIIASITDPFGDIEYDIKASVRGYIIGHRCNPVVNKGDAIINIGIKSKEQ